MSSVALREGGTQQLQKREPNCVKLLCLHDRHHGVELVVSTKWITFLHDLCYKRNTGNNVYVYISRWSLWQSDISLAQGWCTKGGSTTRSCTWLLQMFSPRLNVWFKYEDPMISSPCLDGLSKWLGKYGRGIHVRFQQKSIVASDRIHSLIGTKRQRWELVKGHLAKQCFALNTIRTGVP